MRNAITRGVKRAQNPVGQSEEKKKKTTQTKFESDEARAWPELFILRSGSDLYFFVWAQPKTQVKAQTWNLNSKPN